jgi:hypothetical protein
VHRIGRVFVAVLRSTYIHTYMCVCVCACVRACAYFSARKSLGCGVEKY